ncbi:hypothetical protein HWV62_9831 [Athelia sp. TMB]|nr:hypothetical protein HWV62_9831 [Athelia sp. TMB]
MDEIRLNCALLGPDVTPIFTVSISRQKAIDELKVAIKDRLSHDIAHTDAHRLDLWKGDIVQALGDRTQLTNDNAELLDPTDFVAEHFGEYPAHRGLHIVVQAPHPGEPRLSGLVLPAHVAAPPAPRSAPKNTKPLPALSDRWSPRTHTVRVLHEKLAFYKFMQVRGPPASGKSTLLHLLWARIRAADPHADVHALAAWPAPLPHTDERDIIARLTRRIPGYPNPENTTYLLVDNGQDTYWDAPLWEVFFKSVAGYDNYRVVVFCSYGSAGVRPLEYATGRPMELSPRARVGLAPGDEHADEFGAIGLLLTRGEFGEVVERETGLALERDLQERVFAWTGGHAGAARRARCPRALDLATLCKTTSYDQFLRELASPGRWTRGLPGSAALRDPGVASVLRAILQHGSVADADTDTGALQTCHENGWVFSAASGPEGEHVVYVLPSPLHRAYLEWALPPSAGALASRFRAPVDLAVAVVRGLRPARLAGTHREVNDAPAGGYRDEFYRALFDATDGCVRVSSESSATDGARADFFVPARKWGIELLRDGRRMQERFRGDGAYGAWLAPADVAGAGGRGRAHRPRFPEFLPS